MMSICGGIGFQRLRWKPALHGRFQQRRHAISLRDRDPLLPLPGAFPATTGPGLSQSTMLAESGRMLLRQAHAGGAAHRHTAPVRALNAERIHQGDDIGDESVEAIAARRRLGFAMAALVVPQDTEPVGEVGGLPVPHVQIGGERIREHEPGRPIGTADPAIESDAVGLDLHLTAAPLRTCRGTDAPDRRRELSAPWRRTRVPPARASPRSSGWPSTSA